MIVFAVFILIGTFGTGGLLLTGLYGGAYWALGWVAILTLIALIYFGVGGDGFGVFGYVL
jgi:hypothetical protein